MQRFLRKPTSALLWLLMALVEIAVVTPWIVLLYYGWGVPGWQSALPGAWLPLLCYLGALGWELGSPEESRGKTGPRLGGLAVGVGVTYLLAFEQLPSSLQPSSRFQSSIALALIPAAAYLWYQGTAAAAVGFDFGRVYHRYVRQILITLTGILMLTLTGVASDSEVQLLLFWNLPLLGGAGLILLALTREKALRKEQASIGESGADTPDLSPGLTWVVAGLAGVTLLASHFISLERVMRAAGSGARLLDPLVNWVVDVTTLILIRWGMLLAPMVAYLQALVERRKPDRESQEQPITSGVVPKLEEIIPVDWTPYLKAALILLALLGAAYLLIHLMRRIQTERRGDLEEERISLGLWKGLIGDLASLFSRQAPAVVQPFEPEEALAPSDPRMLLRRLQAWARNIGRPRRPGETPLAFARALSERRPDAEPAAAAVAQVYNLARYSAERPSGTQVEAAAGALRQLEQ